MKSIYEFTSSNISNAVVLELEPRGIVDKPKKLEKFKSLLCNSLVWNYNIINLPIINYV